jgi:DNA-binding Xre family transcriptional regulator
VNKSRIFLGKILNTMKKLDLRYNLKCILRDKDMSQVELADKLDISPTNLNTRLARGKRCQIDLLDKIATHLNVSLDELMGGQSTVEIGSLSQTTKNMEDVMYREKFEAAQERIIDLLDEVSRLEKENNEFRTEKKEGQGRKII